jgi:hypothetical protein
VTELNSHVRRVSPMLNSPVPGTDTMDSASIKPVRYRYVMAYLHDTLDIDGVTLHKAGEVLAILPMTSVTYGVGMYSGTEMTGTVYVPEMWLTQMPHTPLNDFARMIHPDQSGVPVGAMFECGNRALYVMRNEKVVWGGILWTRQYTSGSPTLNITGLSWDGYAYYRALRQSVVFLGLTNVYKIWHTVLSQMLNDFTLTGSANGSPAEVGVVPWTGISTTTKSNVAPVRYQDSWPNNNPKIEMPSATLTLYEGATESRATVNETFRGYDMNKVGEALEQWADTETLSSDVGTGAKKRFEYRVVSWFDTTNQKFRQRYVFGNMTYSTVGGETEFSDNPKPTGIASPLLGRNTKATAASEDNTIIFDYPGHISEWTLAESMEEAATRVIVTGGGGGDDGGASKLAEYKPQTDLLKVPTTQAAGVTTVIGSQGWLVYDRVLGTELTKPSVMRDRGAALLKLVHVPQAAQISDLAQVNNSQTLRTSYRSTDLMITLYTDPTTPFPDWGIGDWATFAIEDPFYGGKMYLQRRIMGYSVTVVPEQENDYSHEQITLDLTDDTKIAEG